MRKLLTGILLLGAIPIATGTVSAQKSRDPRSGVIEGTVETQSGKPANRAAVFLQPADGEAPHGTRTDADGHFMFKNLKQGIYEVRAESALQTSEWQRDINLKRGGKLSLTLQLKTPKPSQKPQP